MTASPINSSKRHPCPICGRTKDGDCRQMPNGTVVCHHPKDLKRGETVTVEGVVWAFTGNTKDDRGGVFKPHEPRQKGHLRVVASGGTASRKTALTPSVPAPLPSLPPANTFALARFTGAMADISSKRDGDYWYFDENNRQQRTATKSGKAIYTHHKTEEGWRKGAGSDCPCWNEACLAVADGTAIYAEGEKVAAALCEAGVLGVSIPGHEAESLEKCTTALKRHKAMGVVELVAYLADNDVAGRKKATVMANAALAAGLPYVCVNAGDIWPDLPEGGSVDDLSHQLFPDEIVAALEDSFREALRVSAISGDSSTPYAAKHLDDPLDKATNEKEEALQRLVCQIVEARAGGDTVRDAALMSQTWRLGIPSATTDSLVLQKWAALRGISTEKADAPVMGRTIGAAAGPGLEQRLPGFLLENGLHLLIADAGVGKTTMSLEMARLLANGSSNGFLDQQEGVRKTGKVLYIGTDGGSTAFQTLSDYATDLADAEQWGGIEFWCEEAGRRKPWVLSLPNLELLVKRLEQGDIRACVVDTINSVFQGAGISPYLGPVDQYLRLLKAIVCPYGPLIMLGHTNRSGAGIKGIGGSPAFQEVPDALHRIERLKQPQEDGTLVFRWTVEKLRGESFRQFSYARIDDQFKVVEGHFFTNCGDKLLACIKRRREEMAPTSPKCLIADTKEAASSVRAALTRLRQRRLIEKKGTGFVLTDLGEARLEEIKL